ncbi:FUSC family protein [Archangium primigenium]|uniref:FUSC family protein n=1 Tax=[Archangium] primigenium TaxID=2792470 RepID=UPI001957AEB6|nr:FUSC family protein [Archangium primigenium]
MRHAKHFWDIVRISDPDLGRLRKGLRAAVGAGLAALILSRLARLLGEPPTVTLVGTMIAMMGAQIASDPDLRAQRLTTVLLVFPALLALVLGTFAAQVPLLGAAVFAVTIFIATFVRRFGPRGLALGMIGFFAFFNALFFHAKLSQLPALAGAMVVAVGIAYVVRFVLLPDRPEHTSRQLLRAFRTTVDVVLWELAAMSEHPRLTPALMRRLSRQADRLSDAALAVEDVLPGHALDLRQRLFEVELATQRVLGAVRQMLESGALSPEIRVEAHRALQVARIATRGRSPVARKRMHTHLERIRTLAPDPSGDAPGSADARRLRHSLTDLVDASFQLTEELLPPTLEPKSAAPAAPVTQELTRKGLHPATRQALQITVASLLAMAAGYAVSAERWYWAVITAFVIFTRTRSSGDTVLRAWGRVLGTVLGVVAGMLLARLVDGHEGLELTSIFVCVFLGFYLIQVSYGWMVFWFTTLLCVLYGLLGRFSPELLYLRIEETLIGAAVGVLIALVLMPERTTAQVQEAARQVLDATSDYLEEAVVNRTRDTEPARLLDSARVLDARLRELRTTAQPLMGGLGRFSPRAVRTLHAVSELVLSVRHLELGRGLLELNDTSRRLLREAGLQLAHNTRALAESIGREDVPPVAPAAALLARARSALVGPETLRRGPASPPILLHWLGRVDEALALLARSLRAPTRLLRPWRA